jgi:hAT family C-terminal dimerisation region
MPQFWGSYLQDWPLLAHFALKVFSVASSSAASERNFFTMGIIHSKLRNCVGPLLCAAKDETSVDIMGRKLCCNFLRKSRL